MVKSYSGAVRMTEHLDLPIRYRQQLEDLLRKHLPDVEA